MPALSSRSLTCWTTPSLSASSSSRHTHTHTPLTLCTSYDSNTLRFSQNDLLRLYCAEQAEKQPDQLRTWRERFVGHYTTYLERFLEAHTLKGSNTDAAALLDVEKANLDALQRRVARMSVWWCTATHFPHQLREDLQQARSRDASGRPVQQTLHSIRRLRTRLTHDARHARPRAHTAAGAGESKTGALRQHRLRARAARPCRRRGACAPGPGARGAQAPPRRS